MSRVFNQKNYKTIRQKLRNEAPSAEKVLWEKIRRRQINDLKFHRQYGIANFIVDFYCPKISLVIELDGDTHRQLGEPEKDQLREKRLKELSLKILRFNNNDIYHNLGGVIDKIYEIISNPS